MRGLLDIGGHFIVLQELRGRHGGNIRLLAAGNAHKHPRCPFLIQLCHPQGAASYKKDFFCYGKLQAFGKALLIRVLQLDSGTVQKLLVIGRRKPLRQEKRRRQQQEHRPCRRPFNHQEHLPGSRSRWYPYPPGSRTGGRCHAVPRSACTAPALGPRRPPPGNGTCPPYRTVR